MTEPTQNPGESLRAANTADPRIPRARAEAELHAVADRASLRSLVSALGESSGACLVGGTVRDALCGLPPTDIDLAVSLAPEEIIRRLDAAGFRVVPTGLKHQTVTVPTDELGAVEITSFRGAGMSPAGGVVLGSTIEEDLLHRDFTINAIAWSIGERRIIDPADGESDLAQRILRAVGDPALRVSEDPLRILRAIRIAVEHDLTIEEHTARDAANAAPLLSGVAVERIREEVSRMLVSPSPSRAFRLLAEWGALELLMPEVAAFIGFEQNRFHPLDLFEHTLAVIERCPRDLVLRLAALLHDVGKPPTLSVDEAGDRHFYRHESVGSEMAPVILERLRYAHAIVKDVTVLVATHMRPLDAGPPGLRRLLRDTGDLYERWRALKAADALSTSMNPDDLAVQLAAHDAAMEDVRQGPPVSPLKSLAVNGSDLLAAGVPEGPVVGVVLRALHERVLDDPALNVKETLLALVPEILAGRSGG